METPPRSEHAVRTATIAADPQQCYDVALNLAAYPDWVNALTQVVIDETDDAGRPLKVTFIAEAIGRSTRYQLAYDHSDAPRSIRWSLVDGDILDAMEGAYTFETSSDQPGATDVTYELSVELSVTLPGFVKRRAETKLINFALPRFKERVEAQTANA